MIKRVVTQIKKLVAGSFFKNVAVLMSGTAIAQGLAFAAAPILSRLYAPEAFGIFGLFVAVCSIIAVVASGKYELAILLPKKDEDAANILWLSLLIIFGVSIFSLIIILLFRVSIAKIVGSPELVPLLWWVPVSIFFTGLYNVFNYWTTRRKQFKRLSISRMIQSTGREGTQLGLGWLSSLQSGGLVLGQVVGQASSVGALITQTYKEDYRFIKNSFNLRSIKLLAQEHQDFPKFNAPQTFLNSVSQNVPAILLAFFFNPAVVGLYWFAHRILIAPNTLIGNSIRQVFYQRANEKVHNGENVLNLYLKATGGLATIGIIPVIIILLFGPILFDIVFGDEWSKAGVYAQWLSLWWFASFINPPSVMLIPILGIQKFQLVYEVVMIILRITAITIGGLLGKEILAIALFSIVGFCLNIYMITYVLTRCKSMHNQ